MKFKRKEWIGVLSVAEPIVGTKGIYEICKNVRIRFQEDVLTFSATDLKVSYMVDVPSHQDGKESFDILVSLKVLLGILRVEKEDEFEFEIVASKKRKVYCPEILLKFQSGEFRLLSEDVRKFPEVPKVKEINDTCQFPAKVLSDMIKCVEFAATEERTRYDLDKILFDFEALKQDGLLRVVATDGKRLSYVITAYKKFRPEPIGNIAISSGAARIIIKCLSEVDEETSIQVKIDKNHVVFVYDDEGKTTWYAIRLAEAVFPPYEKVIPGQMPVRVSVEVANMSEAIRKVSLMAEEKNKIITLLFENEGDTTIGELIITSSSDQKGQAKQKCATKVDGKHSIETNFNPAYLLDVLAHALEPLVDIEIKDKDSALVFHCGNQQVKFEYVVLPIRIREEERRAQDADAEEDTEESEDEVDEDVAV